MPPEALSRTDGGPGRPQGLLCSPVRLTRSPAESSFLISRPAGSRGATAGAAGVGPLGPAPPCSALSGPPARLQERAPTPQRPGPLDSVVQALAGRGPRGFARLVRPAAIAPVSAYSPPAPPAPHPEGRRRLSRGAGRAASSTASGRRRAQVIATPPPCRTLIGSSPRIASQQGPTPWRVRQWTLLPPWIFRRRRRRRPCGPCSQSLRWKLVAGCVGRRS